MDKTTTSVCGVRYVAVSQVATSTFRFDPSTDIIPGVYEGGFTLWECTLDMLQYLEAVSFDGMTVCDVGCGMGLLGIKSLLKGAKKVTF